MQDKYARNLLFFIVGSLILLSFVFALIRSI